MPVVDRKYTPEGTSETPGVQVPAGETGEDADLGQGGTLFRNAIYHGLLRVVAVVVCCCCCCCFWRRDLQVRLGEALALLPHDIPRRQLHGVGVEGRTGHGRLVLGAAPGRDAAVPRLPLGLPDLALGDLDGARLAAALVCDEQDGLLGHLVGQAVAVLAGHVALLLEDEFVG